MPHKMPSSLCRLPDNCTTFLTNADDTNFFFLVEFCSLTDRLLDMHRQSLVTEKQNNTK